jgi:hypothetical protein
MSKTLQLVFESTQAMNNFVGYRLSAFGQASDGFKPSDA